MTDFSLEQMLAEALPPSWRLSHLGQTNQGLWSCELVRPSSPGSYSCAIFRDAHSPEEAIAQAAYRAHSLLELFQRQERLHVPPTTERVELSEAELDALLDEGRID